MERTSTRRRVPMGTMKGRAVVALLCVLAVALPVMTASLARAQEEDVVSAFDFPISEAKIVDTIVQGAVSYAGIQVPDSVVVWISIPACDMKVGDTVSVPAGRYYPDVFYTALGITFRNLVIPSKVLLNGKEQKVFPDGGLPEFCVIGR
jgi:hypothetical protein